MMKSLGPRGPRCLRTDLVTILAHVKAAKGRMKSLLDTADRGPRAGPGFPKTADTGRHRFSER